MISCKNKLCTEKTNRYPVVKALEALGGEVKNYEFTKKITSGVCSSVEIQMFNEINHSIQPNPGSEEHTFVFECSKACTVDKSIPLNHICKEVIQKTAKQCIDDFIILEAKRNLINSGIKSTELTYQLGFTESTNFVKYFKKHTGLTPNQFKKLHSK